MAIFDDIFLRSYWSDFYDLYVYREWITWTSEPIWFQSRTVTDSGATAVLLTPTPRRLNLAQKKSGNTLKLLIPDKKTIVFIDFLL